MKSLILVIPALLSGLVSACSPTGELNRVFAPLPKGVGSPKIGKSGWFLEHFGHGTYMVTDGLYQAMFLVSTTGVILVDAPPSIGKNIGYTIGNVTDKPITHVIYSHSHADHIGEAGRFVKTSPGRYSYGSSVKVIAHKDTKKNLEEAPPDPKRPLPSTTFKHYKTVRVGNQTLELSYKGENHERGNIFIWAPAAKVLMLVDVIFPGWVPFNGLAESTNIPGWIKAHDQVLAYDFKHYIGGHVGRSGVRADVMAQKGYVLDLFNNCKDVIAEGLTDDPVLGVEALTGPVLKNNPGNYWAEFRVYGDITAEACSNRTNKKWLPILGGADAFGPSNGGVMAEALRLDYNQLGPFRNA